MTSSATPTPKIDSSEFYYEYKGHPISDLIKFHNITISERPNKPIIYLAGDSSLDNKFWVERSVGNVDGTLPDIYHKTLKEPVNPRPDVAYWMNYLLADRATCINAAVEESFLRERDSKLLPHDEFIRDNIRSDDILVVSVGGNDVVLKPSLTTVDNMLQLTQFTPRKSLEDGTASSMEYFKHMFGTQIQHYITRLTAKTKPRAVIACMIYYPLESGLDQTSWADAKLDFLGYNSDPEQLQTAIRALYEFATKNIKAEGTNVIPYALYEPLNGKSADDYTARVEPSGEGGKKMAQGFVKLIESVSKMSNET